MITLAQEAQVVNLLPPTDHSGSSISKSNAMYVDMKNYRRLHVVINAGAMTESTANVQVFQAKAAGKGTTTVSTGSISSSALTLNEYWTNKSSLSSSSTGAFTRTSASSSKMVVDSTSNATYMFTVDADLLKQASSYDCLGVGISGVSAAANFGMIGILSDPRYEKDALTGATVY